MALGFPFLGLIFVNNVNRDEFVVQTLIMYLVCLWLHKLNSLLNGLKHLCEVEVDYVLAMSNLKVHVALGQAFVGANDVVRRVQIHLVAHRTHVERMRYVDQVSSSVILLVVDHHNQAVHGACGVGVV